MFRNVSIIIPFFNHGAFIEDCISSIPFIENHEVIIVNDGSSDENSIVKLNNINHKYPLIKIIHQENSGPCKAKNIGVQNAKNPIVLFLDADNMLISNYIEDGLRIFNTNPNIDIIYSDYECFGSLSYKHISGEIDEYKILIGNPIDNCVLIKKRVFESVGGFDESLSRLGLEDWELWINLLKNKANFYYLDKVSFKYRVLKDSRTEIHANIKFEEIKQYIFNKHAYHVYLKYFDLFYENKQLKESLDFTIGKQILRPYRLIKKILFKFVKK